MVEAYLLQSTSEVVLSEAPESAQAAGVKQKHVHQFGPGLAQVALRRDLLGGKGAGLCEMAAIGLPVPPGFVIDTAVSSLVRDCGAVLPSCLQTDIAQALAQLESATGRRFNGNTNPLLVSVRSGARESMPGMMDTVLNLGLNDETVQGLALASGDERFAWDSYRRFIQMYSNVVLGLDASLFELTLQGTKERSGVSADAELSASALKDLTSAYRQIVLESTGTEFPDDVNEQLCRAVAAVFDSWDSPRARAYRRFNNIPDHWGTAVTVQAMVFGNMGADSATGVAFTRDPATGERQVCGEYLVNAQGEDVVAGLRTPQCLTKASRLAVGATAPSMEEQMPRAFAELCRTFDMLERHYRDMQDIEFTVEQDKLWILQTRAAKRTARAALKVAVDLVDEGLIDEETAVRRVDARSLDQLLHPAVDPDATYEVLARGLAASPGVASGAAVFDAEAARRRAAIGEDVILVRSETSPEDIQGMIAAKGILTARGGMTSHAAVVARGMGRPCVAGAAGLSIDYERRIAIAGDRSISEGDTISIDGTSGAVIWGAVATVEPALGGEFETLMGWADRYRRMRVRTNAETLTDCRTALEFGAEGIGLCRTEHMFFDNARIANVRQMILAPDQAVRAKAISALLQEQRSDFASIFELMDGLPVTIRLLDPPLHEFLPKSEAEFVQVAKSSGLAVDALKNRAEELREFNPMLGHRGCRLGVSHPEIYEMQVRAIFEAACDVIERSGQAPLLEVMIPLIATRRELQLLRTLVDRIGQEVCEERNQKVRYLVGAMIELPRAALVADDIAKEASFFSFGTNDLTQTALGISRDDAGQFLELYVDQHIFARDPFVTLDIEGVGKLVEFAAERGRRTSPELKLGICGEHGGDPESIAFFESVQLDYVSASPYRVPVARLAAAQASLVRRGPRLAGAATPVRAEATKTSPSFSSESLRRATGPSH
jgi:pyruvate,orthophosphate dikinase